MSDVAETKSHTPMTGISKECYQIYGSFLDETETLKIPEAIYHYTNDSGLFGIIESGQIWLNDVYGLNDPTEIGHGTKIALEMVKESDVLRPKMAKIIFDDLTKVFIGDFPKSDEDIFIASFSARADDLSQWRSYADNGRGYALGFDGDALASAFRSWRSEGSSSNALKMIYDDEVFKRYFGRSLEVCSRYLNIYEDEFGLDSDKFRDMLGDARSNLKTIISIFSTMVKNKHYIGENEVRLCKHHWSDKPIDGVAIRRSPYKLVRHLKFPWREQCPEALKHVFSGPSGGAMSEKFANDVLKEFGHSGVTVEVSDIPYRC